jgi:hypothetical protein
MKTIIILLHIRLNSTAGNDGYEIQKVFKFNFEMQIFKNHAPNFFTNVFYEGATITRKCFSCWPRRKFVHEVMNFDGAFMNVHVNSWKFMLRSSNILPTVHEQVFMKCSWMLFMNCSWTVDEWPISSWTFCFEQNSSWMFMNVHSNISWTDYSWKIHRIYLMNIWFMNVHDFTWWTTMNYSWTVLVDYNIS